MTSWKLKVKESKSEKYDFFGFTLRFFFFSDFMFILIYFFSFLNFVYFHFIKGLVSKSESKVEKEEENAIYRPR